MWQGKLKPKQDEEQEQELATAAEEWGKCNTPRGHSSFFLLPYLDTSITNKHQQPNIVLPHPVAHYSTFYGFTLRFSRQQQKELFTMHSGAFKLIVSNEGEGEEGAWQSCTRSCCFRRRQEAAEGTGNINQNAL